MPTSTLPRKRPLHTLIWAVLAFFALGTLAQAGHLHGSSTPRTHVQCELCVGFGGLMDAPESASAVQVPYIDAVPPPFARIFVLAAPTAHLFQARAPPFC